MDVGPESPPATVWIWVQSIPKACVWNPGPPCDNVGKQNLSEVDLRFLGRDCMPWKELQHSNLSTLTWFTLTHDPTVGFCEVMELRKAFIRA